MIVQIHEAPTIAAILFGPAPTVLESATRLRSRAMACGKLTRFGGGLVNGSDSMAILDDVKELIALAEQGKFLEAIQRFYAEDATMQENLNPPRVGLAALLENERRVLARVPDIHVEQAEFVVDGDRAAIHSLFAYTHPQGRKINP